MWGAGAKDCGATNLPQVEQFLEYLGGIEDQAAAPAPRLSASPSL